MRNSLSLQCLVTGVRSNVLMVSVPTQVFGKLEFTITNDIKKCKGEMFMVAKSPVLLAAKFVIDFFGF